MIRMMIVAFFLLSAPMVKAQVLVTVQLPATGLTVKSQLWNLSLVNTTNGPMNIQVEMLLTDVVNSQRVLTATTRTILLPGGVRSIRPEDVKPVLYSTGNPGYNVDANPDGFLPIGIFSACYTVIRLENDNLERLAESCEQIEVEPLAPPQLIAPFDKEVIEITRPYFNWLPPAPRELFNNLLFDWVLVAVQPTQSIADAVQQNIPVLSQSGISFTGLQYPLSSPALDTGRLYAWRITARSNTTPVAVSEIWSFRVGQPQAVKNKPVDKGYYSKLRREDDASYIICNGILRYEHVSEINNNTVAVQLTDISSVQRKVVLPDSANTTMQYGQNFIDLDLMASGLIHRHIYLLQVTDAAGQRWYLRFEYRKQE